MALFGKGKTKRPLLEVIDYSGGNNVLIWKHPNEDFNTNAQLIVGPTQEAIFIKGGQVVESFPPGTHTLSTKDYPFIRSMIGLVTGGAQPFQCQLYYVNKVISMGIEWGTDSPIRITDPQYSVPVNITSYGDFSIQVSNGRKLLEKLVGSTAGYTHDEVRNYFSNLMATQIRTLISGFMISNKLTPIGIDAYLHQMSEQLTERVIKVFEPYGLKVNHFTIANISYTGLEEIEKQLAIEMRTNIEFSNKTRRHRTATDVKAEDTVKLGKATATVNKELGFSAKEQAGMKVAEKLAENMGPMVGGGAGMGFGFHGGMIGGNIVQPAAAGTADIVRTVMGNNPSDSAMTTNSDLSGIMPGIETPLKGAGLMEEDATSGDARAEGNAVNDTKAMIDNLKYMMEQGLLSEKEFTEQKQRIIEIIMGDRI